MQIAGRNAFSTRLAGEIGNSYCSLPWLKGERQFVLQTLWNTTKVFSEVYNIYKSMQMVVGLLAKWWAGWKHDLAGGLAGYM